jgi:hypothetical protein
MLQQREGRREEERTSTNIDMERARRVSKRTTEYVRFIVRRRGEPGGGTTYNSGPVTVDEARGGG